MITVEMHQANMKAALEECMKECGVTRYEAAYIVIHSLAPGNGFSIYLDCEAIRPAAIFQLEYSSIASVCHFNSS